ncbi:MAG: alanyl-tRNA editing protein [Spirochaetia bacterium]|nr:alanyl-tRNA editing protein [Spirochaetia bacterium]
MMKPIVTEQVNYQDQYLRELEAVVQDVVKVGKEWGILLDRTIFYPEGGGQPGDSGTVGKADICTTIKRDGNIYHITGSQPDFSRGDAVTCRLDWEHRYDYMQQHTGQHILSGVLYTLFDINTVSVHQGETYLTIETDRSDMLQEEIEAVEDAANRIISSNIPVTAVEVDEARALTMQLRRKPKVSGVIRLVRVGDSDTVACGGMHTASSSEARLAMWIGSEKIRGHLRLYWKVGDRAVSDYREKSAIVRVLSDLYSTPLDGIVEQAQNRLEQVRILKQELDDYERRYAALLISSLVSQADISGEVKILIGDFSKEKSGFLSQAVQQIPGDEPILFCGIQRVGAEDIRWIIAANRDGLIDFPMIRDRLFKIIGAKGGGKAPVWQGKGSKPERGEEFLRVFRELAGGC